MIVFHSYTKSCIRLCIYWYYIFSYFDQKCPKVFNWYIFLVILPSHIWRREGCLELIRKYDSPMLNGLFKYLLLREGIFSSLFLFLSRHFTLKAFRIQVISNIPLTNIYSSFYMNNTVKSLKHIEWDIRASFLWLFRFRGSVNKDIILFTVSCTFK